MIGTTSSLTGTVQMPKFPQPAAAESRNETCVTCAPYARDASAKSRDEYSEQDAPASNHWQTYAREQRLRSDLRRAFMNAVPAAQAYHSAYTQMRPLVDEREATAYAYQTSQLVPIAQHLDSLDGSPDTTDDAANDASLRDTRTALTAALVNQDVYFDESIPQILPKRVRRVETNDDNGPGQSGFFGALYSDEKVGNVFAANRGTEMGIAGRSGVDWKQNVRQALGLRASQYDRGIEWAEALSRRYASPGLIFTGHSLGGGLASAEAAVVPSARALTFDPAGVHVSTVARHDAALTDSRVTAYHVEGEALSVVQMWVQSAARVVSELPIIGGVVKPWVDASIPRKLGQSIALPPSPPPSPAESTFASRASSPTRLPDPSAPSIPPKAKASDWQPPSGIRGSIERHGMHQMIYALFARLRGAIA